MMICCFLPPTFGENKPFDFFIREQRVQTNYKYEKTKLLQVQYIHATNIKTLSDKMTQTLSTLKAPFKLTVDQIQLKENAITLHINDLSIWASKFKIIANNITTLVKSLTEISEIEPDRKISITIDNDYLTQKITDIETSATVIANSFKKEKSLTLLLDNKELLFQTAITLQLLNNDIGELFYAYSNFGNSLAMTNQRFITDKLRLNLLDTIEPIKQKHFKFVESGKISATPTFYIQATYLIKPYKFKNLKPIPYYSKSLENAYYSEYPSNLIQKKITLNDQNFSNSNKSLQFCLAGLNGKLYNDIIKHCVFIHNFEKFSATPKGIFLFDVSQTTLNTFNTQFSINIQKDLLPAYLKFNGKIEIPDVKYGTLEYSRINAQTVLAYSTLTQNIKNKINSTNIYKTANKLIQHVLLDKIIEEYDLLLLNFSFMSLIALIVVILRKLYTYYHNNKPQNNPINIELNRFLKKKPKHTPRKPRARTTAKK